MDEIMPIPSILIVIVAEHLADIEFRIVSWCCQFVNCVVADTQLTGCAEVVDKFDIVVLQCDQHSGLN